MPFIWASKLSCWEVKSYKVCKIRPNYSSVVCEGVEVSPVCCFAAIKQNKLGKPVGSKRYCKKICHLSTRLETMLQVGLTDRWAAVTYTGSNSSRCHQNSKERCCPELNLVQRSQTYKVVAALKVAEVDGRNSTRPAVVQYQKGRQKLMSHWPKFKPDQ